MQDYATLSGINPLVIFEFVRFELKGKSKCVSKVNNKKSLIKQVP